MRIVPAVALVLAALAGCRKNPDDYIARGHKDLDEGKYPAAEIEFLNARQLNTALADAWYGAGLAQFRQKKLGEAYTNLTHAAEMAPQRDDIAAGVADVSIALFMEDPAHPAQYYNQAQTTAANLIKKNPRSWEGLRLTGLVATLDHRFADAVSAFQKANQVRPGRNEVVQPMMESLIQNGQGGEAEKIGRDYLARDPQFAPVYDTLIRWYVRSGNTAAAEKLLKQKIAANPKMQDYRLQLASFYLSAKRSADMKNALGELVADQKDFPDGAIAASEFCTRAGLIDDALAYLSQGMSNSKDKIRYQQRSADLLASAGRADQAMAIVKEILKADPNNADARALRAGIEIENGNPDALRAARLEIPELLKQRPNDAILHYYMGRAYVQTGDTESALAQFEEAMRDNPALVQARVQAANLSMERGDFKRAAQYGDDLVNITRGNPSARLMRINAVMGMGNFDLAQREIDALERDYPQAIEPRLELGGLRIAQKRYQEAEAIYRGLRAVAPKDMRPLQGLVQVYEAQNRFDAALDLLRQEKAKAPSPQLDQMIADVALRGNKIDLAIQSYGQIANDNPALPLGHLRLGDAYMRKGDLTRAVDEFQKAKTLSPHDPLANAMLALALHNAGRGAEAARAYRDTLSLESGNPLVANNLAYLMAENGGNLDEALKLAQSAVRAQPANPALADTLGWVYLKKNLPDSAIQILSNAAQKDPQPLYRYHLAMAFYQKGQKDEARKQCQAALASKPSQNDATRIRDLLSKLS